MTPRPRSTWLASRDWIAIGAYGSIVAVVAVMVGAQTSHQQFGTDVFLHLAAIRELSANLFDPSNPLVSSLDPTYDYSPYTVGLGALGWASGAEPVDLLNLGAAANGLLLASGLWLFSREFSPYRWAPHLALFFSLTAWGFLPWTWSGYWSLNSIGAGLGYPSMFASGIGLTALAGLSRYFSNRSTWMIVGVGAIGAVVAVTHTFTLLWFSVAALAIVASQSWSALRETALRLGGVIAATVALVLLWPYYPVLELWQEASNVAPDHAALYQHIFLRSFLLLPGIAALMLRARRSWSDPLVWMFLGALTVYTVGYLTAHYGLGRITPLIALSSHIALAGLVAGWLASGDRHGTAAAIATIVLIAGIGLLGSTPALLRMVPNVVLSALFDQGSPLSPAVERYASLERILDPADVVFSTGYMSKVVPAVEGRVVVPGYQTLLLRDRAARDRASEIFFSDNTSMAVRDAIASRWSVTHIIIEPTDLASYPWLTSSYDVVADTEFYMVFAIG